MHGQWSRIVEKTVEHDRKHHTAARRARDRDPSREGAPVTKVVGDYAEGGEEEHADPEADADALCEENLQSAEIGMRGTGERTGLECC